MATSGASTEKSHFTVEQDRSYVLYRTLLHASTSEIHDDLVLVRGDCAPSLRTVQRWIQGFKEGPCSISDQPRSGRPSTAITEDHINRVEAIIHEDPHSTLDEIAEEAGISHGSVHAILRNHLRMTKLCARWIPHYLTTQQKDERVECALDLLAKMHRWGANGMKRLVTGDETYVPFYQPGSRLELKEWVRKGDPPPTAVRPTTYQSKVLYTIFFTSEGVVAKVMSPPTSTITAAYYKETVLPTVLAGLREKQPSGKIHLHHDNAPAHRSSLVQLYLQEQEVDLVPHPPYSPDLAPCDFFLFPRLKAALRNRKFESRLSVAHAVGDVLKAISRDEWVACFKEWQQRLRHCVDVRGEYFEHLP
jgi:histone-lysine N-methyltransferase SETMAR